MFRDMRNVFSDDQKTLDNIETSMDAIWYDMSEEDQKETERRIIEEKEEEE